MSEKKEVKTGFFTRVVEFCKAMPKRVAGAFKNMVAELKKVAWPSKKDLINYSIVVIGFVFDLREGIKGFLGLGKGCFIHSVKNGFQFFLVDFHLWNLQ